MTKLEEIRLRWDGPPMADPLLAVLTAGEDISYLLEEIDRLREALGWYATPDVVLNPGPRVAQEALRARA